MYIKEYISNYNEKLRIYVDMDGVIADYIVGKPYDFENKRPLFDSINKLKEVSEFNNVEMYILSICNNESQIAEKNNWLDKYASFFQKENRVIISKDDNPDKSSSELKRDYLKKINTSEKIILIDDDNLILKFIRKELPSIILLQDSSLID
jgi:hypothetical protein